MRKSVRVPTDSVWVCVSITGMYACPCYYYSNRTGTSGWPSFVVGVDLKCGAMTADHWIKRGTALLMSLDY